MDDFADLVAFVERCSIDEQHYFALESSTGDAYDLTWSRRWGDRAWHLCNKTQRNVRHLHRDDVLEALEDAKIPMDALLAELRVTALGLLGFSQMVIEEGCRIFGEQTLEQAQEYTRDLRETLKREVLSALGKPASSRPNLTLVSDETSPPTH